jgi:hypothetical protein
MIDMGEGHVEQHYIGDGVYVDFDGWYVWLYTERDGVTHRIALEPASAKELSRYFSQVWRKADP